MKTFAAFLLLAASAFGQEGIDATVGTGEFPDGILSADIKQVQLERVEVLKQTVKILQARYEQGLDSINLVLELQMELALAQLDTTDDKQERLDYIQAAFNRAVLLWQRTSQMEKLGVGDSAAQISAKGAVFRFRVMWLKEKASDKT